MFSETVINYTNSNNSSVQTYSTLIETTFTNNGGLRLGFFTELDDYATETAYILMSILGVFLNSLTICVVVFGQNVSKEIKIQLINLAVADLLMAITLPGLVMTLLLHLDFPDNSILCASIMAIGKAATYASIFCNTAMSVERFFIIYFPLRAARYTRRHKFIVVAAIWLIACLPEIETLLYSRIVEEDGVLACIRFPPLYDTNVELFSWMMMLKHLLPVVIIVVMYALIFVKVCRRKKSKLRRHSSGQWKKDLDKVSTEN